jgi:D-inositol-3-phosphate glycosyltransferase
MNVYVRELASSLAQAGVQTDVFVRRNSEDQPDVVDVEPGFRVLHIDAGPYELPKEELVDVVDLFADGVADQWQDADVIHSNYWLSGVAGHRLKHELNLPLVSTFHTLARVKAETGDAEPERRIKSETDVIRCSDVILANAVAEADQLISLYGADPRRVEVVPPGVDHAFFSPGDKSGARNAIGIGDEPMLLFVGRIQPLKGVTVAIATLFEISDTYPDAVLVVVGGASGREGEEEMAKAVELVHNLGLQDRVRFVPPQPHHLLSTYFRAADVCIVPSRSESFGLVALEAGACGTPVVGAAVGGLLTLIDHGVTGFLLEDRDPVQYADAVRKVLRQPRIAKSMSEAAATRARNYTWSTTAARLRRLYADLALRVPVTCQ